MHSVFISYSRKDKQNATIVLNILEQNGIRCWIDYRDALPGAEYAGSIVRAIRSSLYFVLVLTKNSSQSSHVLNEVNSAVNAGVTIIPFRLNDIELNDSLEYYLGKEHWLDAITPPIENHVQKLAQVIQHYAKLIEENDTSAIRAHTAETLSRELDPAPAISGCHMATFEDLLRLGYNAKSIATQLVENDYINCNGIGMENEGTAEQWEEYLQNNSDTFHYLINEKNKIIGDWSIVALSDEAYERAMQGQLLEKDFDVDITEMICFPGIYNGYILTICILPEYRSLKNYNMIIHSFFEQLQFFSENGIFFRRWCINVFGKDVEALVKSLGFRYVCDNAVCGKIFSLSFMPLPKIALLKQFPVLIKNYESVEC